MNRIAVVTKCDNCPHFDNLYYGYDHTCKLLNREIEREDYGPFPIPDDCPLPKTDQQVDETTIVDKR